MRAVFILLVCLVLGTDAIVNKRTQLRKISQHRILTKQIQQKHLVRAPCAGECFNPAIESICKTVDGTGPMITDLPKCDDSETDVCCPTGSKVVKVSLAEGLQQVGAMLSRVHAGIEYESVPKKLPGDSAETDGALIAATVLASLTQYEVTEGESVPADENRCGPTTAIAAALNKGGDSFLKLVDYARGLHAAVTDDEAKKKLVEELDTVKTAISGHTLTYGHFGLVEKSLYALFAEFNSGNFGKGGINGAQMVELLKAAGITQFDKATKGDFATIKHEDRFPPGEGWALLIHNGETGHWIFVGTSSGAPGKYFVYDPATLKGVDQTFYYDPAPGFEEANKLFQDYFTACDVSKGDGWAEAA
jgi:hypothetical protein